MGAYVVTGPLAVLKDGDGKLRYYYRDAVLPDDVPAAEVQRLVAAGLVGGLAPDTPPAPVEHPVEHPVERPAPSAAKALWVDYAVARGLDRAEAEKLTRDQLVDRFPTSG